MRKTFYLSIIILLLMVLVVIIRFLPIQWHRYLYVYNVYYTWYGAEMYPGVGRIHLDPPKNYSGIWVERFINSAIARVSVYKDGKRQGEANVFLYANEDECIY